MSAFTEHSVTYTANGEKELHYISAGPTEGQLLIFIHGWPAIAKTWKHQLTAFANLGFRVVALDMPGYGKSTVTRNLEDYSHEVIITGLLALLKALGKEKAVWLGHDWGAGVVSSLAVVHPEVCQGIVLMAVPSHSLELGLEELLKTVNRDVYPESEYPFGQWDYQVYYERNFEEATAFFDKDIFGFTRAIYSKGKPANLGQPALTAKVVQDGGWFGGAKELPKMFHNIPIENLVLDEELFHEVVAAMEKTGFWSANAYYMNHKLNREYNLQKGKNNAVLDFPVLFIEAKWDTVCATATSTLADSMRQHCKQLTEVSIEAGHWVALDKPEETNAAIAKWLADEVKDS
ncbi:alpha hydrolase-15 [Coleophoma cylindrospora]|uniref:Alpha hydrolase-15 n=1 Tax=Coleophoma cylindrospora TaxID=1849047 RepID=A0A3D8RA97_9HELO|nr:alpha hydrolase-15 [Coleophoma cylindrospora]